MATLWTHYDKLSKKGEGAYAKVYLVREKATGDNFAVKKTKLSEEEGVPFHALREIAQLNALSDSSYVVRLCGSRMAYGSVSQKPTLYLIFEALDCDLGDFYIQKYKKKSMPKTLIKSFVYQLLKGVAFIHSHGVIHRDLKTVNILVDLKKQRLKIADFGLARYCTIPCMQWTPGVVTPWYRAPEIVLGARIYSLASDVWSVGMIIAEIVNRNPLIDAMTDIELLRGMCGLLGVPDEKSWPGVTALPRWKRMAPTDVEPPPPFATLFPTAEPLLVDLLSKLLTYNPAKRISAKKALNHPYFDRLDKNQY